MSPFTTRHSMSEDSLAAGDWVESQYASYGFDTSREHFRTNYCSNVIGQIDGSEFPESIVILGAHLDDREANIANVTGRAPVRILISWAGIVGGDRGWGSGRSRTQSGQVKSGVESGAGQS